MTIDEYHTLLERSPARSEHDLQTACVRWFRLRYPDAIIYAIPNGGYRTATTARFMKAEGQLAGIPDLCVPEGRHGYNALYIEMKNGRKGRVSDSQSGMIERLADAGNKVEVVRTFEEFERTVSCYMS